MSVGVAGIVCILQLSVSWFRSVLPCGALAVGDAAASYPSNPAIPKNIPISTYDIIFVNEFVAMHIDALLAYICREGGRLNDPYRISLRLLPLGPGRIGERYARQSSPTEYYSILSPLQPLFS